MEKKRIGIIAGSLRRDSYNKKVAVFLTGALAERFDTKILDIARLALYNADLDNETDMPQEWRQFRQDVKALDAVLFVTPEYNRSMSAALKNALDVASRPMSENAWRGKPGGVVSVASGKMGGFGANHHLRQTAVCLNIKMMAHPEAYIGGISDLIDADGVIDKDTQEFLEKFAGGFADWVDKF